MVKREPFIAARQRRWAKLRSRLERANAARGDDSERATAAEFPALYRAVCHDLALAKKRHYGRDLVERLNALALRGRHVLYEQRQRPFASAGTFILRTFPRTVRAQGRMLLFSVALFYGLGLFMFVCATTWPTLLEEVLSPEQVASMEGMYDPAQREAGEGRDFGDDTVMFGFYLKNNTSIGFRTFAGGLFFGVGALLLVGYNGLFLGAVFGHLTKVGFGVTLYPFVIGHGALELNAIVIAGLAGFKLGFALFAPGRRSRVGKLREVGRDCAVLIGGAALMFFGAAILEAYWSASALDASIKIAVGAALWVLVLFYFAFAGTGTEQRSP
ncbi:MAG: stage II sporulation protein M [Planctomycetes bacterium]|nr:stage II sporulation protein M [Planctomycetota bacterium]